MVKSVRKFIASEHGAVTVDWVVISASVIGMGLLIMAPIGFTADSSAVLISDGIADTEVGYVGQ